MARPTDGPGPLGHTLGGLRSLIETPTSRPTPSGRQRRRPCRLGLRAARPCPCLQITHQPTPGRSSPRRPRPRRPAPANNATGARKLRKKLAALTGMHHAGARVKEKLAKKKSAEPPPAEPAWSAGDEAPADGAPDVAIPAAHDVPGRGPAGEFEVAEGRCKTDGSPWGLLPAGDAGGDGRAARRVPSF